jgi:hypothetical protein
LRQVGEIVALPSESGAIRQGVVREASALLYPSAPPLGSGAELTYVSNPDSLAWAIQTLLPPERKAEIAAELSRAIEKHRDEILHELRPVVEGSLRDAFQVVEQDLPRALERRRPRLEALGARYHRDIVEQELVPLVKEEIWPIVRRHGEPAANEVGREIWQRVSLWRFGWRFAYDKSPLPERQLVEREWRRFVEQEALPVLEEHSDEFLKVVQNSLRDTANNQRVRAVLRRSLTRVVEDPEVKQIVWEVFEEAVIDNPRLHEAMHRNWTGPEAQRAFRIAAERLEPSVRRVGDLVFGTPQRGITPEFAKVLRSQILHKDRRWFLLQTGPAEQGPQFALRRTLPVKLGFGRRDLLAVSAL